MFLANSKATMHFGRSLGYVYKTNQVKELIARTSLARFVLISITLYIAVGFTFGAIYYYADTWFNKQLLSPKQDFWGCVYFSFVTQLTIGYGEIQPVSFARFAIVIQGIAGTAFFGAWVSYAVLKVLTPSQHTVIFSPKAFYILNSREFGVLLINTSVADLTNLRIISAVKFFRRHMQPKEHVLPYLRNSALMLRLGDCPIFDQDPRDFDPNEDGLKVSILCSMSLSSFSTSKKYLFQDILVVETTDFMDSPIFQNPDLTSETFWQAFNQPIDDPISLQEEIKRRRKKLST